MRKNDLIKCISDLTGKTICLDLGNEEDKMTDKLLDSIVNNGPLKLNYNQLNEILLLLNCKRITAAFFNLFFRGDSSDVAEESPVNEDVFKKGIEKFRITAMRKYGNFLFAFKDLSSKNNDQLREELSSVLSKSEKLKENFNNRPNKILDITKIDRNETHLLGYISGGGIKKDSKIARIIKSVASGSNITFNSLRNEIVRYDVTQHKMEEKYKKEEYEEAKQSAIHLYDIYKKEKNDNLDDFKTFINDSKSEISELEKKQEQINKTALENSDIYLTWDYMDLYFATSMRTKDEFESIYDFIEELFSGDDNALNEMNIRHFNPTQCNEDSRVDKSLLEGLMLKLAECTVYAAQETETLGKDSELAATLAQGKTVIAFVPQIEIDSRKEELLKKPLRFFPDRIKLLEESFRDRNVNAEIIVIDENYDEFVNEIIENIEDLIKIKAWTSIETDWAKEEDFINDNRADFKKLCHLIAIGEQYFYDNKRAKVLKEMHPLGIQIELSSGVANGVLVVRNVKDCRCLIEKVLTNSLEFDIIDNPDNPYIALQERLTGCIYRVVTRNKKLTNSFWNWYLKK